MTQKQKVKEYIEKHGSITSFEAFRELYVTRLSAVIFDLRNEGENIECEMVHPTKGVSYGRYYYGTSKVD